MSDHSPEPCTVDGDTLRRICACVNACAGVPTEWPEKYGRTALVRKICLVPADKVGALHEVLSKPLEPSEQIVRIDTCEKCGGILTETEADKPRHSNEKLDALVKLVRKT